MFTELSGDFAARQPRTNTVSGTQAGGGLEVWSGASAEAVPSSWTITEVSHSAVLMWPQLPTW
jgi:hypothetical protein